MLPGILMDFGYIAASILFIFGIKMMGKAETARQGNQVSAVGMLIAIVITLLSGGLSFHWIIVGLVIGGAVGAFAAKVVKMTAMPEMVALFNGFGGLASLLVGWAEYNSTPDLPLFKGIAVFFALLIGGVAFSGSMIAFAKLAEKMSSKPLLFRGQQIVNALIVLGLVAGGVLWLLDPAGAHGYALFLGIVVLSLILGVMGVIPIGGGDMPVVISLLNSYSGMAACAAGFIILNNVLIVAGALVGASGIILTNIMCKAMNRSLANVLFSGFGSASASVGGGHAIQGEAKPISAEDAYYLLEAASSVAIVPGYGMALAQAQHAVRELGELLEKNGAEVRYVIHPVAGRMPGHMNVLLAEANVPYEKLAEMDEVNPIINTIDVCLVIGANDVVNPDARENPDSPIYGMPIINVDFAKTTIVLKRSLNVGFAGIENPLFFKENTRMLFGDAKASLSALIAEFKES